MRSRWPFGVMLGLSFVFHLKSGAQEPVNLITARITSVKESDWQREAEHATKQDGLRKRLQARTLVELTGALNENEVTFLSVGQEQEFPTEWDLTPDRQKIKARKTEKHLIGTEMRVKHERLDDEGQKARLEITLTHDLQPPQTQPMTYATAAVGAERDKHAVPVPRFERLRWKGDVMASQEERLLASFPSPQEDGTRIVVFLQGGAAVGKAMAATTLRQTIYRVPELDMIEWLLKAPRDDAAVVHHLEEAQAMGQASIVSSGTLSMASRARAEAQIGTEHWRPEGSGQYLDQLYMMPEYFRPVLQGTRISAEVRGCSALFNTSHAPFPPLAVKWHTSWLRARDENGVSNKVLHGWMDWHDRFEEQMDGGINFCSAAPHLVAMMPPPDQLWGTQREGRWLDVTLMQQPDWTDKPAPEDIVEFSEGSKPEELPRHMFIGIALDRAAAHALLAPRKPGQDDAPFLHDLLARARAGHARVMSFTLSAHAPERRNQTSARWHAYPTEMPSIPSAWADQIVGTRLEEDGAVVAITQHLAPPARTEWRLARDVPEAIMWQPRFRHLSLATTALAVSTPGTHLLAAADLPELMAGVDLPAHECYLFFSHLESGMAPAVTASWITGHDFEIETQIFEISVRDATAWQSVKTDDFETFSRQQLNSGRAKLQSHSLLRSNPSTRATLSVVEDYRTATEFDPPSRNIPFRMRPTALTELPVGLQFEGELGEEPDGNFSLNIKLKHSTARPIEPSLEETLRLSADKNAEYPGAKHELDDWTENISPTSDQYYRLLPPTTTSSDKGTTRSAWVRVRRVK